MGKTATVIALIGLIPYVAIAQSRQVFGVHHEIQFAPGSDAVRKPAAANPVTNEKVAGYRALAVVEEKGVILVGEKAGPGFGQQLVYPMEPATPPAPVPPAPRAPGEALCAGPLCTENPLFAATITDFRALLQDANNKTLIVRVTFSNKLDRPLALGYVRGSAVASDDRGNRYVPSGARAVQGIGEIAGHNTDLKFVLQPRESSDARFEFLWQTSGQEIFGLKFQLDLAIREIAQLPGNQIQLGREYALHFGPLEDAPTTDAGRRLRVAPPAATVPPEMTPPPAAAAVEEACAGYQRGSCVTAGPFAAAVVDLTPSFTGNTFTHVLKARVRFRNLTAQPIVLGFVARSAVVVDNYGGRYTMDQLGSGEGAAGIGVVDRSRADPQFMLQPNAAGEAAFTLSRRRRDDKTDPMGNAFSFDLTIAQLQILESQQIRTQREYSLGFTGLVASAGAATTTAASGECPPSKRPVYCAGPFMAEVMGTVPSFSSNGMLHVIQARVRFTNVTEQPIVLAYVADSALFVDTHGGRYSVLSQFGGDGMKGMGTIRGTQADPQFVLKPRASGDVTFTLSRRRNDTRSDPIASAINIDMTIAQLEVLRSQQIHTVREYAVSFPGVGAGGRLLDRILQAIPKKGGGQ